MKFIFLFDFVKFLSEIRSLRLIFLYIGDLSLSFADALKLEVENIVRLLYFLNYRG